MFRLLIFFSCVSVWSFSAPFSLCVCVFCFEDHSCNCNESTESDKYRFSGWRKWIHIIHLLNYTQSEHKVKWNGRGQALTKKRRTNDAWIKMNDRIEQKEYKKRNEYIEHVATVRIAQKETQSEKNNFISIQMADALLWVQLFRFLPFYLAPSCCLCSGNSCRAIIIFYDRRWLIYLLEISFLFYALLCAAKCFNITSDTANHCQILYPYS